MKIQKYSSIQVFNMTILEFGYPLTYNVKARDPVGSKKKYINTYKPKAHHASLVTDV